VAEDGASSNPQAHVIVRGRVQGVNFRWNVLERARANDVTGWVRNLADGSVEAILQGPSDRVNRVVDWMRRGPPGAWVSSVELDWSNATEPAAAFEIVR
jgi:acylphosphatase